MEVPFCDRPPTPTDEVALGVVDRQESDRFISKATTTAWNWQMGARLQWLENDPERLVVYNVRTERGYAAEVQDVHTGETRRLPLPVYELAHSGSFALTLNFARLADTRPGYGYVGWPDPNAADAASDNDGVWRMDMTTGASDLILSLHDLVRLEPDRTMQGAKHWVNHLWLSPRDQRVLFFHRWRSSSEPPPGPATSSGLKRWLQRQATGLREGHSWFHRLVQQLHRRYRAYSPALPGWRTRLLTCNPDGTDVRVILVSHAVSHFDWQDDEHLLVWAHEPGVGPRYLLVNERDGTRRIVGEGVLDRDGHCRFSPNREWVVTDTYPQSDGKSALILYRPGDGRCVEIGRFAGLAELTGETRCDLHPRWNRDGTAVAIDSVHEGSRQVYSVDVASLTTA
jgi:hypothetical protein